MPKALKDGQIFDPQSGAWTPISKPSPAFDYVKGDVGSWMLPDGRVLLGGMVAPRPRSGTRPTTAG